MRFVWVAVLLILPAAAAQAPEMPFPSRVDVEARGSAPELEQGSVAAAALGFRFNVTAVCPQPGTAVVDFELSVNASGIEFQPASFRVNATVPQGVHGSAGQPPYQVSRQVEVQVLVSELVPPGEYGADIAIATRGVEGCPPFAGEAAASSGRVQRFLVLLVRARRAQPVEHPEHEEHGMAGFDFFLDPGASRTKVFNVTGVFPYHDHVRPELRGTVMVEPSGPDAADVVVTAQGFRPQEARVGKGGAVRWTNMDTQPHVVSADELHPQHAAGDEDAEFHEPAPAGASGPPRRVPGWEGALLAAGLGAALLRPRRR